MSNKSYGLNYERKEKKYWIDRGHYCFRSRGSFGLFDMIVTSQDFWRVIQVKSTKLQGKVCYTKEIEEIDDFKTLPPGTVKMLVLYQRGKREVLYEKVVR